MRPNRRYSNPFTSSNAPKGPYCSHCQVNLALAPAYIICAFNLCNNLPICVACFSVGAANEDPHQPNHPYRVIRSIKTPLYSHDWSANDEQRLLHSLAENGPNHWRAVSEYVGKSVIKCEKHYQDTYLTHSNAPFPIVQNLQPPKRTRNQSSTQSFDNAIIDITADPDSDNNQSVQQPSSPPSTPIPSPIDLTVEPQENRLTKKSKSNPLAGKMEGFMPLRQEFDVEFDDTAEQLIADLSITPNDTQEERELKIELLNLYSKRVQRRWTMMDFVFDNGVLDFAKHKITDRRATRDEKELIARLRVFSRILKRTEFQAFYDSVLTEYRISRELYRYARGREVGIMTKAEVEIYEIERKARNAKIIAAQREIIARKRDANAKNLSNVDNDDTIYSPNTPDDHALPSSSAATHSPTLSEDIVMMDAHSPISEQQDTVREDLPGNSSSTLARKARERRRVANSPFPQVEPLSIISDPNLWKLSSSEAKMCAALRIAPSDFLKVRDAMLLQGCQDSELPPEDSHDPPPQNVITIRAERPRRKARTEQALEKQIRIAKNWGTDICQVDEQNAAMKNDSVVVPHNLKDSSQPKDHHEHMTPKQFVDNQHLSDEQSGKQQSTQYSNPSAHLASGVVKSTIDEGSLPGSAITEAMFNTSAGMQEGELHAVASSSHENLTVNPNDGERETTTPILEDNEDCVIVAQRIGQRGPITRSQKLREFVTTGLSNIREADSLSANDSNVAVSKKRRAYKVATVKVNRRVTRSMAKELPDNENENNSAREDNANEIHDGKSLQRASDQGSSFQASKRNDERADYTVRRSTADNHMSNVNVHSQPNLIPNISVHTNSVSGESGQASGSHDNNVVVLTQEEARGLSSDVDQSIANSDEPEQSGPNNCDQTKSDENSIERLGGFNELEGKRIEKQTGTNHFEYDNQKPDHHNESSDVKETSIYEEEDNEDLDRKGDIVINDVVNTSSEFCQEVKSNGNTRVTQEGDDPTDAKDCVELEVVNDLQDRKDVNVNVQISLDNNPKHSTYDDEDHARTRSAKSVAIQKDTKKIEKVKVAPEDNDVIVISSESAGEESSERVAKVTGFRNKSRNGRRTRVHRPASMKTRYGRKKDKGSHGQAEIDEEILDEGHVGIFEVDSKCFINDSEDDFLYIPDKTTPGTANREDDNGSQYGQSDLELSPLARNNMPRRKRGRPSKDSDMNGRSRKKVTIGSKRRPGRKMKRSYDEHSTGENSESDRKRMKKTHCEEVESESMAESCDDNMDRSGKSNNENGGIAVRRSARNAAKSEKKVNEMKQDTNNTYTRQSRYSLRYKK